MVVVVVIVLGVCVLIYGAGVSSDGIGPMLLLYYRECIVGRLGWSV